MRRVCGALVALAAVFLLHGLQCAGHDSSPWTTGAATAPAFPEAAVSGMHHSPLPAGDSALSVVSDPIGPGSAVPQLPLPSPGDLWVICLAVLSAGLALVVLRLPRPGSHPGRSRSPARAQRWLSGPALARPPDLFVLCVLRN